MADIYHQHLSSLKQLQNSRELSIIKLSEPILAPRAPDNEDSKRGSDASSSTDGAGSPTPASLEADLRHYKDLFTKLRFSYVEQVTKEKFLRAVVGDPPLYVDQAENAVLESQLLEIKTQLKQQKTEVAELCAELERRGREISRRYQNIQLQTQEMESLPAEIENLQQIVDNLRSQQPTNSENPVLNLTLNQTMDLISERERELADLDQQLSALDAAAARRSTQLTQLESELKPLESQKMHMTAAARDARKRREQGESGAGDELEERGRWLKGVETTMTHLLEVST